MPEGIIKEKPYWIESELGVITTNAHKLTCSSQSSYNSSIVFFEETSPRERFKSNRFMELALDYSTDTSNRKSARRLNRIRLEEEERLIPTTFRNIIEREGEKIQEHMVEKCDTLLINNGFNTDCEPVEGTETKVVPGKHIAESDVAAAALALDIKDYKASDYELPETTVNISLDDVCVKRQSDNRPKTEEVSQPKRVYNTIVQVQNKDGSYILNAASLIVALKFLIGFLLQNGIMEHQLVVFADGARVIHAAVTKMFRFTNYKIILDWYHLKKRCQELLSMALKGSKIRNAFLDELVPLLWNGNVDGAISLLENISAEKVKDHEKIITLVEYLTRVREYVPCYALRKKLGLRNSSNHGEKANDMVVSSRQKHNGMSWSNGGSLSFATVASASCNREISRWIHNRDINFYFVKKAA
jgi:hypothetical protein